MKKILLLFLLLPILLFGMDRDSALPDLVRSDASATNQLQHPLQKGLVFDMPMTLPNIRGATTALDISANTNHGTASNCTIGATYTTFNGTTSYVDVGADKPTDLTGDITISAWIYPTGWGERNTGRILGNGKYILRVTVAGDKIQIFNLGEKTVNSADNSVTLNTWHHVLTTRPSAGTNTNIYINGVLSGTANQDFGTPAAGTTNTFIGKDDAGAKTFDGYIAHVRIWNRILTTAERTAEYNRLKGTYQP